MFEISLVAGLGAVIVTQPEISVPELVMNCFAPSITHSPSSSRARVRVLPASEPASGSVSPKAASLRPGAQLRQPLVLLLRAAPEVDRHRPQRRVGGERDADRGVDPRQLLDRERVGERVGAAAAVLLGERDPHQAQLAHLGDDLVRERASSRSSSSATGATSLRAKSRTVRWSRRCSSVSVEVHARTRHHTIPAVRARRRSKRAPSVHSLPGDRARAGAGRRARPGSRPRRCGSARPSRPGSRRACTGCSSAA